MNPTETHGKGDGDRRGERSIIGSRRLPAGAVSPRAATPAAILALTLGLMPGGLAAQPAEPALVPSTAAGAIAPVRYEVELGSCAACHADYSEQYLESPHAKAKLTCTACHGGDQESWTQEEAMDPAKKFAGKFARRDIPALCARCHSDEKRMAGTGLPTDQFEHYRMSFHGTKVLKEGDTTAAVCTDCHGTHRILPPIDPRSSVHRANVPKTCDRCHGDVVKMNVYAIPTDQYEKWSFSFHGKAVLEKKDLSAAVCTDCHGNHDIANPSDPRSPVHPGHVVDTCARCHADEKLMSEHGLRSDIPAQYRDSVHGVSLLKKGVTAAPSCIGCHGHHGALPPAVKNVAMVCGRCHTRSEEFYNRSPHKESAGFKGCIECHGVHDIHAPGSHLFVSACERCHPSSSPALELGRNLSELADKSEFTLGHAKEELESARGLGFSLEALETVLQEGRQTQIEVIPALHTLDVREAESFLEKCKDVALRIRQGIEEIRHLILMRNMSLALVLLCLLGAVVLIKLKLDRTDREHEE